jgi:arabinofuranosyltransferase
MLWLLCLWVVLRNAWLCEDAFITYRVVDNFVHGLGLRWNPLERVQVFTHPLWTLCLIPLHAVSHDPIFSGLALGITCSAVALGLLLRSMRSPAQAVLAAAAIVSSKALMDFSTGGLENPLSHLMLVLFFLQYLRVGTPRGFGWMVLWMGLAATTRMDLALFCVPAIVHTAWSKGYWRLRHARLWAGLLPFVAWSIFALLYYGFVFPSSAYAKLGTHVPALGLATQGVSFLSNSLSWDPVTLFAMTVLTGLGLASLRRDRRWAVLSLGVLVYLAYVIRVGGDYMTGRMLSAPLIVCLVGLSRVETRGLPDFAAALGITLLLGFCSPRPPLLSGDDYKGLGKAPVSVDDERGYRYADTGLLRQNRHYSLRDAGGWVADGQKARTDHTKVIVYKNIGFFGYYAGPDVHIIDPYGLGDALMGRLPYDNDTNSWDAGHFERHVPEGYTKAALDQGHILDPGVAPYWEKLELVTRGPIFSRERLATVLSFTLGRVPPPTPALP